MATHTYTFHSGISISFHRLYIWAVSLNILWTTQLTF